MKWIRETLLTPILKCDNIRDLEAELGRIRSELRVQRRTDRSLEDDVRHLHVENAELKLYVASLIWLLLRKNSFSQDELTDILEVIDRSDGSADGRYEGDIQAWGIGGE